MGRERIAALAAVLSKCSDETLIDLHIGLVLDAVLAYCNITELPEAMESLIAQMAADRIKAGNSAEGPGNVKSIARGDTRIEYAQNSGGENAGDMLNDYRERLNSYRRPKVPGSEIL